MAWRWPRGREVSKRTTTFSFFLSPFRSVLFNLSLRRIQRWKKKKRKKEISLYLFRNDACASGTRTILTTFPDIIHRYNRFFSPLSQEQIVPNAFSHRAPTLCAHFPHPFISSFSVSFPHPLLAKNESTSLLPYRSDSYSFLLENSSKKVTSRVNRLGKGGKGGGGGDPLERDGMLIGLHGRIKSTNLQSSAVSKRGSLSLSLWRGERVTWMKFIRRSRRNRRGWERNATPLWTTLVSSHVPLLSLGSYFNTRGLFLSVKWPSSEFLCRSLKEGLERGLDPRFLVKGGKMIIRVLLLPPYPLSKERRYSSFGLYRERESHF